MGNVCECIRQNNVLLVNEYKIDIGKNLDRKKKLDISIEKSKGNAKEMTKENSKENSTININKMNNELKNGYENIFTINDNISIIEPLQNDEISFINNEEINKIFQTYESHIKDNQNNKQIQNYYNKKKTRQNIDEIENDFSKLNLQFNYK